MLILSSKKANKNKNFPTKKNKIIKNKIPATLTKGDRKFIKNFKYSDTNIKDNTLR